MYRDLSCECCKRLHISDPQNWVIGSVEEAGAV
jgi:hypothetical protein